MQTRTSKRYSTDSLPVPVVLIHYYEVIKALGMSLDFTVCRYKSIVNQRTLTIYLFINPKKYYGLLNLRLMFLGI